MSSYERHAGSSRFVRELPVERTNPLDPPDQLSELREEAPLARLGYPDGSLGWLATSYELSRAVLRDDRFSAAMEVRRVAVEFPALESAYGHPAPPGSFVGLDPPEHTRYRRLLNREFTTNAVERLRPAIEVSVDQCVDAMRAAGPPRELVADFALPIPSLAISALLGVPAADRDYFNRLADIGSSVDSSGEEAAASRLELTAYLEGLVEIKRARPDQDLLTQLAQGDELTPEEIAGVGTLLLTAGFETTKSMLALGVLTLLVNRDQLDLLMADPALFDGAVDELLRYLSIVHLDVSRTATVEVPLGGEVIQPGEAVTVSLPAANRDPARFEDPDRFDVTRSAKGHLAFVHGIHACIGQHLARLEMRIALPRLFQSFPGLRLEASIEELEFGGLFYGVKSLPVGW